MKLCNAAAAVLWLVFTAVGCSRTEQAPANPLEKSTGAEPAASAAPGRASVATQAAASAAAPPAGSAAANPNAADSEAPLNVLLLTIDSMRADMPWTGYERDVAPNLTELAKKSVVYTRHYSASSHTGKSVSALLTGRYPSAVYRSGWFFASFPDANLFFTEVLQQRGVRTLGGHAHGYFDRGKQLDQGFDVWKLVPGIGFDNSTDRHVTSDKLTDLAIEMLSNKDNSSKQLFMWLHYMDPHDQYLQHAQAPTFGKKARDRYDAELFFTDLHVGRLLDYCKQQPWWEKTAVIVSADHGEAFGEHGMYKHAFELWEVLTHVPLLVSAPGVTARRIEERRSSIDLAPTILELMGEKQLPKSFQGRSLVPELRGAAPDNREPIVLDLPEDHNNPQRRAILKGAHKLLVRGDSRLLFDIDQDPGEAKDLYKKDPEAAKRMNELYERTVEQMQVVEPFGGMKLRSGKSASGPQGP